VPTLDRLAVPLDTANPIASSLTAPKMVEPQLDNLGSLTDSMFSTDSWLDSPTGSMVDHPLLRGLLLECRPRAASRRRSGWTAGSRRPVPSSNCSTPSRPPEPDDTAVIRRESGHCRPSAKPSTVPLMIATAGAREIEWIDGQITSRSRLGPGRGGWTVAPPDLPARYGVRPTGRATPSDQV
jgi:hypothetical protein